MHKLTVAHRAAKRAAAAGDPSGCIEISAIALLLDLRDRSRGRGGGNVCQRAPPDRNAPQIDFKARTRAKVATPFPGGLLSLHRAHGPQNGSISDLGFS